MKIFDRKEESEKSINISPFLNVAFNFIEF